MRIDKEVMAFLREYAALCGKHGLSLEGQHGGCIVTNVNTNSKLTYSVDRGDVEEVIFMGESNIAFMNESYVTTFVVEEEDTDGIS